MSPATTKAAESPIHAVIMDLTHLLISFERSDKFTIFMRKGRKTRETFDRRLTTEVGCPELK
jgi:hypothetical protein